MERMDIVLLDGPRTPSVIQKAEHTSSRSVKSYQLLSSHLLIHCDIEQAAEHDLCHTNARKMVTTMWLEVFNWY